MVPTYHSDFLSRMKPEVVVGAVKAMRDKYTEVYGCTPEEFTARVEEADETLKTAREEQEAAKAEARRLTKLVKENAHLADPSSPSYDPAEYKRRTGQLAPSVQAFMRAVELL